MFSLKFDHIVIIVLTVVFVLHTIYSVKVVNSLADEITKLKQENTELIKQVEQCKPF